ncbi:CorA family divalent cation transporter [Sphingomonas radiodurans]|uniref:CorA family divalent cation transporter n=1 Tax=Sphingomonas radiodurans TaxID=2890321 RepID=UPI001E2BCA40|nr:CorA family divalent cation transporter [Sphingomonas radiodurans]WBH15684.1 zinc transporter ZntB [Sphingomonas radiodurans]
MSGFGYRVDGDTARKIEIKDALGCGAAMVWVHLSTTAEHAQAWLRDEAKLSEYIVEALTANETRPRCEAFDDGAYLNLRGRTEEPLDPSDMLASVRIWAEKGQIISVTRKHLLATDMVEHEVTKGQIRDPGDLITGFATAITADLDPVVADLGDDLDDCEQQLDTARVFELRRNVTRVRVESINYRRFLNPQRQALERLATLPGDWLGPDDRAHLAAAADRAARMAEELEAIRERSSLMHEALTDLRAEQLDQRGLVISIAAMVFLPLTFLTGLYGMNVEGLWFAKEPWAFDAIVGLCVLIAVGVTVYFVARRWFR